jgi:hypothetical protein
MRGRPQNRRQSIAGRRDSSVDDLRALGDDPDLAFFLVQVDGTMLHGWSSPLRLTSVQQHGAQATTSLRRPAASS